MIFEKKRYNGLTFYKERGKKRDESEYILVDEGNFVMGCFECVSPVIKGTKKLGVSAIDTQILRERYMYVPPSKVPASWIEAFRPWIVK